MCMSNAKGWEIPMQGCKENSTCYYYTLLDRFKISVSNISKFDSLMMKKVSNVTHIFCKGWLRRFRDRYYGSRAPGHQRRRWFLCGNRVLHWVWDPELFLLLVFSRIFSFSTRLSLLHQLSILLLEDEIFLSLKWIKTNFSRHFW